MWNVGRGVRRVRFRSSMHQLRQVRVLSSVVSYRVLSGGPMHRPWSTGHQRVRQERQRVRRVRSGPTLFERRL